MFTHEATVLGLKKENKYSTRALTHVYLCMLSFASTERFFHHNACEQVKQRRITYSRHTFLSFSLYKPLLMRAKHDINQLL